MSDPIVIFFVRAGLFPKCRIDILTEKANNLGATVLTKLNAPVKPKKKKKTVWEIAGNQPNTANNKGNDTPPAAAVTHFVINNGVSADDVRFVLSFDSLENMFSYISNNGIQCAIPEWICEAESTLERELSSRYKWEFKLVGKKMAALPLVSPVAKKPKTEVKEPVSFVATKKMVASKTVGVSKMTVASKTVASKTHGTNWIFDSSDIDGYIFPVKDACPSCVGGKDCSFDLFKHNLDNCLLQLEEYFADGGRDLVEPLKRKVCYSLVTKYKGKVYRCVKTKIVEWVESREHGRDGDDYSTGDSTN